jgi:hypothetical protein
LEEFGEAYMVLKVKIKIRRINFGDEYCADTNKKRFNGELDEI